MGDIINVDFAAPAAARKVKMHSVSDRMRLPHLMWQILEADLSEQQLAEFSAAVTDLVCFEQADTECQILAKIFHMLMQQGKV